MTFPASVVSAVAAVAAVPAVPVMFGALPSLDPSDYIWNLGWILIPLGAFFLLLGFVSGYRRWHVNPKHINELRANRSRLRKDRDQLLAEFGLEREDLVGMEVDDEVIEARSSRRSSKGRSSKGRSSGGRSRSRSSSGSGSSRSRSERSTPDKSTAPRPDKPGSDTKSGVTRGIRSLPPTAAEKARLKQGPVAEETTRKARATKSPDDFLEDAEQAADTTEPPPPADKLFALLKNKSIKCYEGFGPLFIDWPKKPDDLKRISGIGEELEGKLNDIGVFMLWQVAYWNDENIASIAEEMYLERPVVAAWVDEARRLKK